MDDALPPNIAQDATLRGNEYGWSISSFPNALAKAQAEGYACFGGQFQFRLENGKTCEMYWLNADSNDRTKEESWSEYSQRSCAEVLTRFQHLVSTTDFAREASSWTSVQIDPTKHLVFVAYFLRETDVARLSV